VTPRASTFITSAAEAAGVPDDDLPQVVFVGRSNVGKSSLINALTRAGLARTSARPGKTRLINVYRVALDTRRSMDLVDLPGYGYAGAAPHDFETLAAGYWARRRAATAPTIGVLVADARHPGLEADEAAWAWLCRQTAAVVPVVNKVDKLSRAERVRHLRRFESSFGAPPVAVSAAAHEGVDALWKLIVNRLSPPPTSPR
jgi:GTP-binding protein